MYKVFKFFVIRAGISIFLFLTLGFWGLYFLHEVAFEGLIINDGILSSLFATLLIFVVFWFLLIRPQQRKIKLHREMINNLKRGDKIVTSGGIIGTVERVMDNDRAEVIVGDDTKVEIIRSTGVQGLIKAEEPKK